MAKRTNKTKFSEIVSYWETRIYEGDLGVDWCDAEKRCWRCGCERRLEKCHIIPHALGGKDDISNLILLCNRCHKEAPNSNDEKYIWKWIKASRAEFYDIFWAKKGLDEYERIYNEKITDCLKKVNAKQIKSATKKAFKNAIVHYGEGSYNVSTLASIIKNIKEDLLRTK